MDWDGIIQRNSDALKRVLVTLAAMAGLAGRTGAVTLPRRVRNAVLRLLRPAESATRRLIVVAARDIVVKLPPFRPLLTRAEIVAKYAQHFRPGTRHADRKHWHALYVAELRGLAKRAAAAKERRRVRLEAKRDGTLRSSFSLPLLDPLADPTRRRIRRGRSVPRIWFADMPKPAPLPPPPSPDDLLDATRIGLRLQALGRILENLPEHAKRLARWKARRERLASHIKEGLASWRPHRSSPMKPGRPPGLTRRESHRPRHEVHHVLKDLQYFAWEAWVQPDTS